MGDISVNGLGSVLPKGDTEEKYHVEICLKPTSLAESQTVKEHVIALLDRHRVVYGDLILTSFDDVFLQENV